MAATLLDKLWDRHVVAHAPASKDACLLFVDRSLLHEETTFAFHPVKRGGDVSADSACETAAAHAAVPADSGPAVRFPQRHAAFADHYAPTRPHVRRLRQGMATDVRIMLDTLADNATANAIPFHGLRHPDHGIMHVAAAQLGMVLPGMLVTGSDSHTCTLGALGAFAFGIGQTEHRQVLRTQSLWRRKPLSMQVMLRGSPGAGVSAKDVILALIREMGVRRAAGHVLEFAGDYVAQLCMDQRLTLCNMAIEAGAVSGLIAPDTITAAYLKGKPHGPHGHLWDEALADWETLSSDVDARHDESVSLRISEISPMVTWGTGLDQAVGIAERVPEPADYPDAAQRTRAVRALQYMGLRAGQRMLGMPIDIAFIGSCNSSRMHDLRAAAAVLRGRKVSVPTIIVPGAQAIRRQAEQEGLADVFTQAGCEWREPGCSMCVGSNGETVPAGLRCASSSPRNFEGRQGPGARTHVMSAAMVATAALGGRLDDIRNITLSQPSVSI